MKGAALFAAAVLLWGSAAAQPIRLYGTIGTRAVFLDLSRNGDAVSGWYFQLRNGKQIRLDGKLNPRGFFQIEEYTANTNTHAGTFAGRVRDGHWTGTWRSAGNSRARDISFSEIKGKLRDANGRYRCTARHRDRQFGFSNSHRIDLTLSRGRVKAFSMTRRQISEDGDDQSCRIALRDLKQATAPVGILMRTRTDGSESERRCTIRIYGAGDYLVVRTGDPSQAGDDCRGAGDTTFCSPRSFWGDIVVNRKAQTCTLVE